MMPNSDFLKIFNRIELFFEKSKLFYENMWAPTSFDRFNFFVKSLEHVILDKDFEKSEINKIMARSLINSHLEQMCGKRVYFDGKTAEEQKSYVPKRWFKNEILLTALSVGCKDFDLGVVGVEMKRLAVNDKFFEVALDLLDKQLKEMKAQATQILVELGQRHGLKMEDDQTQVRDIFGDFTVNTGLKSEINDYMEVRD